MRPIPRDEEHRKITRASRGTTLVLEAGAGTGKTTLLVDRIESLVRSGDSSLLDLAAVTFTDNAAATMKLRLRERLEWRRVDASVTEAERARGEAALQVLERAQVSTIHAFCASILQERPLECGVVPGFRVADEVQAEALFAEAWDEWLAERLDAGDPVLAEALRQDIPLAGNTDEGERSSLRGLARTLRWQRDLAPLVADGTVSPESWRDELLAKAVAARALRGSGVDGDSMVEALRGLESFADSCRFLEGEALADRLLKLKKVGANLGRKGSWRTAEDLGRARDVARWTGEAVERWRAALGARLHAQLVGTLAGVLSRYAARKQAEGLLDYVDLLVLVRDALRRSEALRRHVRRRFRHLFIDEFQDTDPVQVQIAELVTGETEGRLVVVGDAKQSIYRFRRADVALFRALAESSADRPGRAVLHLTQNFRSRPAILRFVNRAFADLITYSVDADQPAYEPIVPRADLAEGPAVTALAFPAPELSDQAQLLGAEARAAARLIAFAAEGGYEVREGDALRPSRAGDVMVLAPRLTQIRFLEDALDAVGIPFAVDGGKSFFGRQEVHEALATLRAIDDPSDRASLVAALRSCFFGASDRDIVECALTYGPLSILHPLEAAARAAEVVSPALALLGSLHRDRLRVSVPALIERLYDETRVLASLTGTRRGSARAANLEKVTALARQSMDLGALTLRGFVRLLAERVRERSEEPDLPSTRPGDPDTVRILSIHKAKGLEAPIVVLHDLAASLQARSDVIALWTEGKVAIGFRAGCRPPDWNALVEKDKVRAYAEGKRLLYVACTRARDRLVIPRLPANAQGGDFWAPLAPHVAASPPTDVEVTDAETLPEERTPREVVDPRVLAGAGGGDAAAARWDSARRALLAAAAQRPLVPVSATALAARTAPPPVAPAASTLGRDFGSLVHRILEWIPLDAPGEAGAMAEGLAPAFGVDADGARRAAEAVERALALPVLRRAREAARLWRELPVAFADGGALVEGVIDLVFEEDEGLVVVDYKTDAIAREQALAQAAHHAPQLQLYGRGLALATGVGVRERLVLFTALGQTVPV